MSFQQIYFYYMYDIDQLKLFKSFSEGKAEGLEQNLIEESVLKKQVGIKKKLIYGHWVSMLTEL